MEKALKNLQPLSLEEQLIVYYVHNLICNQNYDLAINLIQSCNIDYLNRFLAIAFLNSGKNFELAFKILDQEKNHICKIAKAYYLYQQKADDKAFDMLMQMQEN